MADNPDHYMPKDELTVALAAARLADPIFEGHRGTKHVILPEGFSVKDIPDPYALPPVIAQQITVDDRASATAYINRFSDARSVIIADYDALQIRAQLDYHQPNEGGAALAAQPGKHTATLHLRASEEFKRWDAAEGEMMLQAAFAAFLEENAVDVIDPAPAVMIEISRDLEAVQDVTFSSRTRLESGDRAFTYETETKVKGELKVPKEFLLSIPLFVGEPPVEIRAALRFKVTAQGLLLGFQWRRVEYQRQSHFALIAHEIAEATGRPVFFGRLK